LAPRAEPKIVNQNRPGKKKTHLRKKMGKKTKKMFSLNLPEVNPEEDHAFKTAAFIRISFRR
jgi:hypothetical protein